MKTNLKRGIATGALAAALLAGTGAAAVAAPVQSSGANITLAAQSQQRTNVGQLVSGLINVNVGAVAVNIGDVTIADLIDVSNVLNNNQIDILNNVLNNSPILSNNSDILTNLLRDANLITDNQVVVGVLSGGLFVIQ
jgi:hypothetical protein